MEYLINDGAIVIGWLFSITVAFGLLHLIRKFDKGVKK